MAGKGKIRKFLALDGEEKRLFVEAYIVLGYVRVTTMVLPFKNILKEMEFSTESKTSSFLEAEKSRSAQMIGQAIGTAAAHTPWKSTCLLQALAAKKMLQRRGIPGTFYLGVSKEKTVMEHVEAHAWSQCGKNVITGKNGYERFRVMSSFSWKAR